MRVLLIQKPDRRLKQALQEQGCVVDTADCEFEGDQKVTASDYSLVVLDIDLPGKQGLRLVEDWRKSGIQAHILVLTAHYAAQSKVKALNVGADALVSKPYHREELVAQIKALLRRARPGEGSVLQVGDLEIDTSARAVKRAGQPIKLTRREYALLQCLATHRGKVVSRSMILANLFDGSSRRTSNVIDVHIRSLRVKLDKGFERPLIQTSYGEGYSLSDES